jgi:nitrogen fixation protein NifU and related proteins
MSALDQLYQQVILDHAKQRHGHGLREPVQPTGWAQSRQFNPLCGDEVTLRVAVTEGSSSVEGPAVSGGASVVPTVTDVSWDGEGCQISQASSSVLHDLVVGRPVPAATALVAAFRAMIRSRGTVEPDETVLGDAVAFVGVGRHANRVKCAMLGWTAFEDALSKALADLYAGRPGQESGR